MRDIKMIMQKNDLQIARIKRVRFGSYTLGELSQGDFAQADPDKAIMKEYFAYKKKLIREKQSELKDKMLSIQESMLEKGGSDVKAIGREYTRDIKTLDKSKLVKNKLIE